MNFPHLAKIFTAIIIGVIIWNLPIPEGMEPKAWHLFSIFVSTITAIILKPFPMGTIALIGMLATVLSGVLTLKEGLSGFSGTIIWLVVFVFFVARGFVKTNLGSRIAYFFMYHLGARTLGLGYGIILTELLIAPCIPSNSARTGGIMLPVVKAISEAFGSCPKENTQRKLGSYLALVTFYGNLITSAMFLTGMAANPMAQAMAKDQGITITWINWFMAALVPGLCSIFLIPLLLYFIYPPEIKFLPQARDVATQKLKELGPMSSKEWIMTGVFLVMLSLWIFGERDCFIQFFGIVVEAPTAALIGLSLLLLTNVIEWKDVLQEQEAWHTMFWLAILVTMSTFLTKFGFIGWFSGVIQNGIMGWHWHYGFLVLLLTYFYSHYFFASNTAHVTAMYAAFLMVSISIGAPPLLSALILAFFSSLFSSMTHYGTTAGAILYSANYVPLPTWWANGFIISVVNIIIWLGVGGVWWKILGIW